jgi:hypothetical protein
MFLENVLHGFGLTGLISTDMIRGPSDIAPPRKGSATKRERDIGW